MLSAPAIGFGHNDPVCSDFAKEGARVDAQVAGCFLAVSAKTL